MPLPRPRERTNPSSTRSTAIPAAAARRSSPAGDRVDQTAMPPPRARAARIAPPTDRRNAGARSPARNRSAIRARFHSDMPTQQAMARFCSIAARHSPSCSTYASGVPGSPVNGWRYTVAETSAAATAASVRGGGTQSCQSGSCQSGEPARQNAPPTRRARMRATSAAVRCRSVSGTPAASTRSNCPRSNVANASGRAGGGACRTGMGEAVCIAVRELRWPTRIDRSPQVIHAHPGTRTRTGSC